MRTDTESLDTKQRKNAVQMEEEGDNGDHVTESVGSGSTKRLTLARFARAWG